MDSEPRVDCPIFTAALMALLKVCVPLVAYPDASERSIGWLYRVISTQMGVVYLWSGVAVLVVCVWIAARRYGAAKLGDADSMPQCSGYSWISMLFCAGVATRVTYWGTIEWTYYIVSPPSRVEPRLAARNTPASSLSISTSKPAASNCSRELAKT